MLSGSQWMDDFSSIHRLTITFGSTLQLREELSVFPVKGLWNVLILSVSLPVTADLKFH